MCNVLMKEELQGWKSLSSSDWNAVWVQSWPVDHTVEVFELVRYALLLQKDYEMSI